MLPKDKPVMYNFLSNIFLKALSISSLLLISSCTNPQNTEDTFSDHAERPFVSKSDYLKTLPLKINAVFVDPSFIGISDGQKSSPYKTIERAIKSAQDGQHIYLREGRYSNATKLHNLEKSLTISAYPGEKVLIDGTQKLTLDWQDLNDGVYKAKVSQDIWELFVDNNYSYLARWPNATFEDGKIWRMTQGMRSLNGGYKSSKPTGKSRLGLAYDDSFKSHSKSGFNEGDSRYADAVKTESLAESGMDISDCIAVLNIGHWQTWARPVTQHKAGSDHFSYDKKGIQLRELHQHTAYYIYGLAALDKANEWWYDKDKKELYFKVAKGIDIKQLNFRSRKSDFMLELTNVKNLSFKDIEFHAAGYNIRYCENIGFENCKFEYLSSNKFVLGKYDWFNAYNGKTDNTMSAFFGGKNNQVINCIFKRSNAPVIFRSDNSLVQNCLFEDIEWDVNTNGGSGSVMVGKGSTIEHYTLKRTGNSEGIRATQDSCSIRYNRVYDAGNLQHDGAGINVGTKVQKGAMVHHNWVHDCNRQGVRFDYHSMNVFQKDGSVYGDGLYAFNVMWNTQPSQIKGDRHFIFNNTVVSCNYFPDPTEEPFNFSIQGFKAMHGIMGNENSIIRNNLANISHRSWDLRIVPKRDHNYKNGIRYFKDLNYNVLPGTHDHNFIKAGSAYAYLRDPQNLDFRPKNNSPLIASGKSIKPSDNPNKYTTLEKVKGLSNSIDIGAYQSDSNSYWIPGFQADYATQAIPLDKGQIESTQVDLMFLEAYKAPSHKIYFGTNSKKLSLLKELKGSNICPTPKLKAGTRYFWRVDAVYDGYTVPGETWSFKVSPKFEKNLATK